MMTNQNQANLIPIMASARSHDGVNDALMIAQNAVHALSATLHAANEAGEKLIDCVMQDAGPGLDIPAIIVCEQDGKLHVHVFETRGGSDAAMEMTSEAAKFMTDRVNDRTMRAFLDRQIAAFASMEGK